MANFYIMSFNSLLAYYNSKKCEDLTIEDDISQLLNDFIPGQK